MALADRTVAEVAELLATGEPAPGGGSAAALTGALAAALCEMAAAFALRAGEREPGDAGGEDGDRLPRLGTRASELRHELLELAQDDMRSYAPVLAALALDREDPERSRRVRSALAAAAEVPLAVAAAAADVGELAAALAPAAGVHVIGDAAAAAVLAEASTRAAARLVELNLSQSPEDERLAEARELAQRAWAARTALLA